MIFPSSWDAQHKTGEMVTGGIEAETEAKLGTYMVVQHGRILTAADRYGALVHHAMESRQCKDR